MRSAEDHISRTSNRSPLRRRGRGRWFIGGCLLLAVVSHPWWLREIGDYLADEQPFTRADVAVVLSGDHRLQKAVELLEQQRISEIWLLEQDPSYAVSAGILSPRHEVEAEELVSLGVSPERIRVLTGEMRDVDDAARMIVHSLDDSLVPTFVVICDRLHGRNLRWALNDVKPNSATWQPRVLGVPSDKYHPEHWWKSRAGWKDTFNAACHLTFTIAHGVDLAPKRADWDADEYERQFISTYGDKACHESAP